jgi:hypothetical protein
MLPRLSLAFGVVFLFALSASGDPPAPVPMPLPVGTWTIEFANRVVEVCEVRQDGTATVAEPRRTANGKVQARDGVVFLTFDDERIERWTPVGQRMVVEHWAPGEPFPVGRAVLGIGRLAR